MISRTREPRLYQGEQRTELQIRPVYGLTTAAAIWMSAAMGIACGAGRLTIALGGTVLTLLILKFKLPWAKKDNPFITFTTKRSS